MSKVVTNSQLDAVALRAPKTVDRSWVELITQLTSCVTRGVGWSWYL